MITISDRDRDTLRIDKDIHGSESGTVPGDALDDAMRQLARDGTLDFAWVVEHAPDGDVDAALMRAWRVSRSPRAMIVFFRHMRPAALRTLVGAAAAWIAESGRTWLTGSQMRVLRRVQAWGERVRGSRRPTHAEVYSVRIDGVAVWLGIATRRVAEAARTLAGGDAERGSYQLADALVAAERSAYTENTGTGRDVDEARGEASDALRAAVVLSSRTP
jgi:hypothetical protein